ncbi:MAG TPA: RsmB/NOP family class I SAM-dependent RNA methyltransferase [Bacteroidia bacterium]|nr:RsmB/NOP family class I SAM-dependent RNA methyltransferase [Bacteroidia bacterium]
MKVYKNLVNAVAETLQDIFTRDRYADKALEKKLKAHPQWGSRDRRFVAEAVYDIVRYKRLYTELIHSPGNFWMMVAAWMVLKGIEFPDWPEFRDLNRDQVLLDAQALKSMPVVSESYPDWLWELGVRELGDSVWEQEARAMNQPAKVVLRVNSLKCTEEEFLNKMAQQAIQLEKVPDHDLSYVLRKRENVFRNTLFREGFFEIQDAGSQGIAPFLDPRPGELVVDACAGAGGKSLHLAALMKNKGKVISMDLEQWKLDELKKRARRAGAYNIETLLMDTDERLGPLLGKADRLLLDVPCSGSGVFRRNPDAKWKLSLESIERTKLIQQKILRSYSAMLKPGGDMVYSTCSIFPSENHLQVENFLKSNPSFRLVAEKNVMPSAGFDGFYMARLKRVS